MASGDGDAPQAGREANLHPRCPAAPASAAAGGGAAPSQDPTRIRSRYGGPRGSSEGACRRGAAGRIRHWREGPPSTNPATDPLCGVIDCPPLVLALAQPRSRNPGRIAPPRARRRKKRSESGPGRRMKSVARQLFFWIIVAIIIGHHHSDFICFMLMRCECEYSCLPQRMLTIFMLLCWTK
jgi:hypothetical protein